MSRERIRADQVGIASLVAWFPDRLHVTKWHTAFLLFVFYVWVWVRMCACAFVCAHSEHMCVHVWCGLKLTGKTESAWT